MTRPAPPPLEVQYPLCPTCGNTVDIEDCTFRCDDCHAEWPAGNGSVGQDRGQWDAPESAQCESIDGRFMPGGQWALSMGLTDIWQCLLSAGHDGDHAWADGFSNLHCWDNTGAATPDQLAQLTRTEKSAS